MWTLQSSRANDKAHIVEQALDKLFSREDLGFFNLNHLTQAIADCRSQESFFNGKSRLAVIGLGGSSLGTKAFFEALVPVQQQGKIKFLDNVDAHSLDQWLKSIDKPEEWGWVLCSKSGSTMEVIALYDYCAAALQEQKGHSIVQQTVVVTENKPSLLFDMAQKNNLPLLHIPLDIGGRFSVFTPIGLFPLHFAGLDLEQIQQGFSRVLSRRDELVPLVGQMLNAIEKQEVNLYSFQYCDRLVQWSLWLQQLWSESLGKSVDRKGEPAPVIPTFVPGRGASDQHSILQQIMEGPEKKFVLFHQVESSEQGQWLVTQSHFEKPVIMNDPLGKLLQIEAEATCQAIQDSGIHTLVLKTKELTEASVAELMGLWMLTIGVLGEILDINAFDQPGVESGKLIARRVLSQSR